MSRSLSGLSSTSESSGSGVVTLGTITVTGTSGTAIKDKTSGSGYTYNPGNNSYAITDSGAYYLDTDIDTANSFAIEILASNVTLDGNGHSITYTGTDNTGTSGVLIDSTAKGATVENFAGITGFEHGISAYAEDAEIENNTVYWNDYGIYSNNTSATIFDNNASSNIYGIWSSGDYANISDNIACFNNATGDGIVTGGYGIWSSGDHATIEGNNASFNSVSLSRDTTSANDIIDNIQLQATGGYGIYSTGNNSIISNNGVNNNSASAALNASLSIYTSSTYLDLGSNEGSSRGGVILDGLISVNSNNVTVNGGSGIRSEGDNLTISNNTALFNSVTSTLNVNSSQSNFISCSYNGPYEFDIDYLSSLSVSANSNSATANGGSGILANGDNLTISNNTASFNSATSILNTDSSSSSSFSGSGLMNSSSSVIYLISESASSNSNIARANGGSGILANGDNLTISNNIVSFNSAISILNASSNDSTSISSSLSGSFVYSPLSDSASSNLNNATTKGGFGIQAEGDNLTISNNIASFNSATSILNASSSASASVSTLSNSDLSSTPSESASADSNSATTNGGSGIQAEGDNFVISNNNASDNNPSISASAVANSVNQGTTTSLTGGFGINSTGNDATITGNRVSANRYGIGISDTGTGLNLTGNFINQSTNGGLNISDNGGGGSGYIFNNYFGSDLNVCATASSASQYHWNNTDPRLGTNIVGGSYHAGNYWSNSTGNGWSDQQTPNATGYSLTPYEVTSGVYDYNPLIGTLPTATPTTIPTVTPTQTRTSDDSGSYFMDNSDPAPDHPGIYLVITSATFSGSAASGRSTTLNLVLENKGSIQLSPQARIVLVPANAMAQSIGEQPLVFRDGTYHLTYLLQIPSLPGNYVYIFRPVQITRDPTTGQDIRIPAGDPVQFTVTVGADGTVTVRSP